MFFFLHSGDKVLMQPGVSLTDLLPGVDITRYYRYLGSLTTPSCNEAVVWSVFKDTIKVSRDVVSHKYNGRANRHKHLSMYL